MKCTEQMLRSPPSRLQSSLRSLLEVTRPQTVQQHLFGFFAFVRNNALDELDVLDLTGLT